MTCHIQRTRIVGVEFRNPPRDDDTVGVVLRSGVDVTPGDMLVKPLMPEHVIRMLAFLLPYPKAALGG